MEEGAVAIIIAVVVVIIVIMFIILWIRLWSKRRKGGDMPKGEKEGEGEVEGSSNIVGIEEDESKPRPRPPKPRIVGPRSSWSGCTGGDSSQSLTNNEPRSGLPGPRRELSR
jgi:hypothetical protein